MNLQANDPAGHYNNGTVDAADYVLSRKGGALMNEVDTANEQTSKLATIPCDERRIEQGSHATPPTS